MERIGRYEILNKIGEGGMGSVFLAHDTGLDRRVAVKMLLRPDATDDQLARFEREGKAVAALNHPNILAIYDVGLDAHRPFIVMELLDGRTLRTVMDDGPIPVHKAIRYGLEVAQGLAAAHDKGIYHRDLKPQNIFVTEEGRIKIVDFGLAVIRRPMTDGDDTATQAATASGTVLGTVGYMSPEQVRGEPADHRADIFALGCVLFEMLTGTRTFWEPTAVETMHAILKVNPSFELLERLQAPDGLLPLVRRCLEKRAAERFQSARDLAFLLQTLEKAPVASSPVSGIARAAEPISPRTIAVLPFANLSHDPEMEYFSDGVTEDIINALARLPELRVAGRTSSFTFRGQAIDLAVVRERLKVETVLEGSVRRSGNRLRVTTRLIEIESGYQMWAERYDRELDDVFAIQDDIATNIAHHLRLTLSADRGQAPVKASTSRMEAYDLYLHGRYLIEQRGTGIAKGLALFQKALSIDPEFALAFAAIAETLVLLRVYGVGRPEDQRRHAPEAARRALALDPSLAEVHNSAAMVQLFIEWDWAGAEVEFDRALEINPNHVSARYWKGCWVLAQVKGEFDAGIAEIRRAVELDPMGSVPVFALGLALVGAGRPDEALEAATEGLKRDPESTLLHRVVAGAALAKGDHATAVGSLETLVALTMREAGVLAELGVALAAGGRTEEAGQIRNELEARAKTSLVPPTSLAVLAEALGDREAAVRHVQSAVETRDPIFLTGCRWPSFERLRQDDRVRKLFTLAGISPPVS